MSKTSEESQEGGGRPLSKAAKEGGGVQWLWLSAPLVVLLASLLWTSSWDNGAMGGLLNWVHHRVVIASHSTYPLQLMFGLNLFGNVLLRKECEGEPYPSWMFGYLLGFTCYCYASAIVSDLLVLEPPRVLSSNHILAVYTLCYLLIQTCGPLYRFLVRPPVFCLIQTWWLADVTRASMCFLERAVANRNVFARGVFQVFVWCCAGPLFRTLEANLRGGKVTPLSRQIPNSFNPQRSPLLALFAVGMVYLVYLGFFSDCDLFAQEAAMDMVQCGKQHQHLFAGLVYAICALNLGRGLFNF